MTRALKVVARNAVAYRRHWLRGVLASLIQPTLFLLAFGAVLGRLVDRGGTVLPGGVRFVDFLAPGLLAGASMQTAASLSTWMINDRMRWRKNYVAMVAAPLAASDLVVGEIAWIAIRAFLAAVPFLGVMSVAGIPRWPSAWLTVPAAVLTAVAFSAVIVGYAASRDDGNFSELFRYVITPLYLFSGTFFPIADLPPWLQHVATTTPLYHAVELVRAVTLGTVDANPWPHAAYLAAMTVGGTFAAVVVYRRKLLA